MATFAVTTRSHLRSLRFLPSMALATLRVRRQLQHAPGCLRFASVLMGPRDFWTITVWRTRQEMLDFMRSGAHEEIMWSSSRWLDSFWLMRWKPTAEESGSWRGLQLAEPPTSLPEAPTRTPEQQAALDAAFSALPRLRAATDASGAASLDRSPHQTKARELVAGAVGATVRLEVPGPRSAPRAWRRLSRIHSALTEADGVLRSTFGMASPGQLYVLAIFRNREAFTKWIGSKPVRELKTAWPEGVWTMRWDADNEFGHWDGLRLRRAKLGNAIDVPPAARAAARLAGSDAGTE